MSAATTIQDLYDALSRKLGLEWVAGQGGAGRHLQGDFPGAGSQGLAGALNCIHPNRIQVIGRAELVYFSSLDEQLYLDVIHKLFSAQPAAVILSDQIEIDDLFIEQAEHLNIPLLRSRLTSKRLIDELQYYLTHALAERKTVHGVFVDVLGVGTLLTGQPAVGKSELAFELISRGHQLVADDVPEFARIAPDIIVGTCPPLLKNFLEVRGLGIINIREMFGDSAIEQQKYLQLIIHLKPMTEQQLKQVDRLRGNRATRNILGLEIPEVTLPVAAGRELSILVEAAVRQHLLLQQGYDAAEEFIQHQAKLIAQQRNDG